MSSAGQIWEDVSGWWLHFHFEDLVKRSIAFKLRLTPDEYLRLRKKATKGYLTMTAFIVSRCEIGDQKPHEAPKGDFRRRVTCQK